MVFVKTLNRTLYLEVAANEDVLSIKQKIEAAEGIPSAEQRLVFAGRQLEDSDCGLDAEATIYVNLELLGGAKKRKKKVYTTPKKNKRKPKKVKLAVLKYYKVDENGKITRLRKECQQPSCGGGVFMAQHANRHYCGRCHDTLVVDTATAAATSGEKGGKKGKK
uniref:Ubiquitin-like protein 1-ribosomal protein eS31 fusion protein n=1 Tax=Caenorhabditis briggsae TaxID=6238 RepID=RS27A_CAEBR|nr:RecName: Full=Ubiquitin-like protein 1-ribosomal protein eS31 fusion protein; Contains: RecName: Full=Ubiquitin-like protein 1; Contains: RecName: Full=Small ribosomal subunit protein eS31; AltName: Full=40S ribosomal protein S27a [Caenorhabditis briggsae]AAA28160.1 ubiquitin-like:ribosomal protein fusion protein [Caenorhabditis briggsae]